MLQGASPCPPGVRHQGVGLLSHVLPHCEAAVNTVVEKGGTALLLTLVKVGIVITT